MSTKSNQQRAEQRLERYKSAVIEYKAAYLELYGTQYAYPFTYHNAWVKSLDSNFKACRIGDFEALAAEMRNKIAEKKAAEEIAKAKNPYLNGTLTERMLKLINDFGLKGGYIAKLADIDHGYFRQMKFKGHFPASQVALITGALVNYAETLQRYAQELKDAAETPSTPNLSILDDNFVAGSVDTGTDDKNKSDVKDNSGGKKITLTVNAKV